MYKYLSKILMNKIVVCLGAKSPLSFAQTIADIGVRVTWFGQSENTRLNSISTQPAGNKSCLSVSHRESPEELSAAGLWDKRLLFNSSRVLSTPLQRDRHAHIQTDRLRND